MKKIILLLTGLSVTILLLSLNRLTSLTTQTLAPYEYLRLLDFNAMLTIPILTVVLYTLLFFETIKGEKVTKLTPFFLVFVIGIYLFGASSGTHEVTNYLNHRFCDQGKSNTQICQIISYNHDSFSHVIYYIGIILLNVALLVAEFKNPFKGTMTKKENAVVIANAVFIALGIFANLSFEEIGLDLYFFGIIMTMALYLLWKKDFDYKKLPLNYYSAIAFTGGVVGTVLYKLLS